MKIATETMSRGVSALDAYFRCPLDVEVASSLDLSAEPGFFTFGGAVCYGRVAGAVPAAEAGPDLPDVTALAGVAPGRVTLPFDLDEVVDCLRFERYCRSAGQEGLGSSASVRSLYYLLRPLLTVGIRKHLQRIKLRDWKQIPFPSWPVDTSVDALMSEVLKLEIQSTGESAAPFIWFWPAGAPAAAAMTHDVETANGLAFCDTLMDLDESFGVTSSFQLIPEDRYSPSAAVFERFRARGFEPNIHDLNHDGHLFDEPGKFRWRAARINKYATEFGTAGFRSACMYRRQEWFDALEVGYDMSVPNVAHLEPQRGGCCTVLPYFIGGILELPLTTIQDYSLFEILGEYSQTLWTAQVERIVASHGLATFNTHPDYLFDQRARAAYRTLLGYLSELRNAGGIWVAAPSEINRWWRWRSQMSLRYDSGCWRADGEGSEQARVGIARIIDARLVVQAAGAEYAC
jgi:hypothetical protein